MKASSRLIADHARIAASPETLSGARTRIKPGQTVKAYDNQQQEHTLHSDANRATQPLATNSLSTTNNTAPKVIVMMKDHPSCAIIAYQLKATEVNIIVVRPQNLTRSAWLFSKQGRAQTRNALRAGRSFEHKTSCLGLVSHRSIHPDRERNLTSYGHSILFSSTNRCFQQLFFCLPQEILWTTTLQRLHTIRSWDNKRSPPRNPKVESRKLIENAARDFLKANKLKEAEEVIAFGLKSFPNQINLLIVASDVYRASGNYMSSLEQAKPVSETLSASAKRIH